MGNGRSMVSSAKAGVVYPEEKAEKAGPTAVHRGGGEAGPSAPAAREGAAAPAASSSLAGSSQPASAGVAISKPAVLPETQVQSNHALSESGDVDLLVMPLARPSTAVSERSYGSSCSTPYRNQEPKWPKIRPVQEEEPPSQSNSAVFVPSRHNIDDDTRQFRGGVMRRHFLFADLPERDYDSVFPYMKRVDVAS